MLADLDDPPKSRWKGIVVGVMIAAPLTFLFGSTVLPPMWQAIVGSSRELDERFAVEANYLNLVCTDAVVLERDENMCACVLGSELPSIDCRPRINAWMLARQVETCALDGAEEAALSFCTCVNAVHGLLEELNEQTDSDSDAAAALTARREITSRFENCVELEDVLALPELADLTPVERGGAWRPQAGATTEMETETDAPAETEAPAPTRTQTAEHGTSGSAVADAAAEPDAPEQVPPPPSQAPPANQVNGSSTAN